MHRCCHFMIFMWHKRRLKARICIDFRIFPLKKNHFLYLDWLIIREFYVNFL